MLAPVAVLHLVFAVGIVPLIFAAMSHFVPVLTRTGDLGRLITLLPFFAQLTGLVVVATLAAWLPRSLLAWAAAVDLMITAILLRWIILRARLSLGRPHPGWRWYALALACLMTALFVVPLLTVWPDLYRPLRSLHLHLNTLGLVGLAALGTLPVLMPTALGQTDPLAASGLRTQLWPAGSGVLLVAVGASGFWPLSLLGAGLLLLVLARLFKQWRANLGLGAMLKDGAACSLLTALLGFGLLLLGGVLHACGLTPADQTIPVWISAFLLPLVSGALSQLIPVWRWPGPSIPARALMRQKLVRSGVWRAGLFFAAGLALMFGFSSIGVGFLGAALLLFMIGLLQGVRVVRSTR